MRDPAFPPASVKPTGLEALLYEEGDEFDFFQAVRLLERLAPDRHPVGRRAHPGEEAVRFRVHSTLVFPPSPIQEIQPAPPGTSMPPTMVVRFMGLTGICGVLPRHYTELLLYHDRYVKGEYKYALRDWFDLFNHRLVSLFHRAWEKYRFYVGFERAMLRGPRDLREIDDAFSPCLFSFIGLGQPTLRDRLAVVRANDGHPPERLAGINDLGLLRYAGFLASKVRSAVNLEAMLGDYFRLPVRVLQFARQWLVLDPPNQSRLGDQNSQLGVDLVVGERVEDVQSKFRIVIGPVTLAQFQGFLPDRAAMPERKTLFVLSHLVRLFAGPEYDFDVQVVLRASDVPTCQLPVGDAPGPRLGWDTWLQSEPRQADAHDAVFAGEDLRWAG